MGAVPAPEPPAIVRPTDNIDLRSSDFSCELRRLVSRATFGSKSEIACAYLLEKYCPYFLKEGKNFQIEIAGKQIDFRLGETFIEYHPVMLERAFINTHAYKDFAHAMNRLPAERREPIERALLKEFEYQYYKQRRLILDLVDVFRNCKLILCGSPEDFIERVLKPNAVVPLPKDQRLLEIFDMVRKRG